MLHHPRLFCPVMILLHILECCVLLWCCFFLECCVLLWCCIISYKNTTLNHTAVITSDSKHKGISMLPPYFTSGCSKCIVLFYFCSEYRSAVSCSTGAQNRAGENVGIAWHLCKKLCPVDTHWICIAILTQRNTNVQQKWRLNCLTVGIKWPSRAIWICSLLNVPIHVKTACSVATVVCWTATNWMTLII
jgi:hypothetical protein